MADDQKKQNSARSHLVDSKWIFNNKKDAKPKANILSQGYNF